MWQPAWTDAQKARVLDLAKEGHSAGAIARMVNQQWNLTKTRNAVIGLCFRNKASLTGHTSKRERQRRAKAWQARQVKASQPREPRPTSKQTAALRKIFAAIEPLPEPSASDVGRVHIYDLEHNHCRFPVGDTKDGMFCGDNKIPGLPYCAAHSARCFRPPEVRPPRPHIYTRSGAGFQVEKGITYSIERLEDIQTA